MIRFARDFRLIPIVLVATISLFVLKVSGLIFDGGYTFAERMQNHYKNDLQVVSGDSVPDYPKIVVASDDKRAPSAPPSGKSWAQQMFNYNGGGSHDITGSVSEPPQSGPPLKVSEKPPGPPTIDVGGTSYTIAAGKGNSPGERAILQSLQERREQLDARSRTLDMRENLLKAAEKRVEAKINELKDVEAKVKAAMGARDKVEAERFKGIVAMYENMKAKDAARIFDRLNLDILIDVSTVMNPRKMSEILAQMTPESAEKLTVEMAKRANAAKAMAPNELPKIQGKPTGQ